MCSVLSLPRKPDSLQGLRNCWSILTEKSTGYWRIPALSRLPFLCLQQHRTTILQLWISSPCSKIKAMSPPGKGPRKENLGLQCEWGSCSFVCSAMEEFFKHVTQHLQEHVHGSKEEEEEDPLGKGTGKSSVQVGSQTPGERGRLGKQCLRFVHKNIMESSYLENSVSENVKDDHH